MPRTRSRRSTARGQVRASPRQPREPRAAAPQRRTKSACAAVSGMRGPGARTRIAAQARFSRSSAASPSPPRLAIQQPATRLVRPIPARQCRYTQRPSASACIERVEDLPHAGIATPARRGRGSAGAGTAPRRRRARRRAVARRSRARPARSGRGNSRCRRRAACRAACASPCRRSPRDARRRAGGPARSSGCSAAASRATKRPPPAPCARARRNRTRPGPRGARARRCRAR